MSGRWEKITIYTPKREASEEASPTDTLISDLQLPELRDSQFPVCKRHSLWYLAVASHGGHTQRGRAWM